MSLIGQLLRNEISTPDPAKLLANANNWPLAKAKSVWQFAQAMQVIASSDEGRRLHNRINNRLNKV